MAFSAKRSQFEAGSTTTGSIFLPMTPPLALISSNAIMHDVAERHLADGHGAGERVQHADLDRAPALRSEDRREADARGRAGSQRAARS